MPALSNLARKGLTIPLPGNNNLVLSDEYDRAEKLGVTVIVVCAALSMACVIFLLGLLTVSFLRNRRTSTKHFVSSHAATYFTCLLLSEVLQSAGTLINAKWLQNNGIVFGVSCFAQGAIKNVGNLGVSLWTLVLGTHIFTVLFLRWNPRKWALYTTLIGVWLLIAFIVIIGPLAIQKIHKGPYFGISGLWCWITDAYPTERITMEYMWMLGSAFLSFLLYTATFLRLRGNIYVQSGRIKFRRIPRASSWKYVEGRDSIDIELTNVAKGMIGFPVLFTIVILPITVARFVAWSGKDVPVEATIFGASIFSLTGVFDLILFLTTRSLLPQNGFFSGARIAPRPKTHRKNLSEDVAQPYNVADFSSAHGFNQTHSNDPEKQIVNVPPRTQASLGLYRSSSDGGSPRLPPKLNTVLEQAYRPNIQISGQTPVSAWDDIDIGRQVRSERNNFGERQMSMPYAPSSDSAYSPNDDAVTESVIPLHSGERSSSAGSPETEEERERRFGHSRQASSNSTRV